MRSIFLLACLIWSPLFGSEPTHLARQLEQQKDTLNPQAIAQVLWAGMVLTDDVDYMKEVIAGMRAADKGEPHAIPDNFLDLPLHAYALATRNLQGKQNLANSDAYFATLQTNSELQAIENNLLYTRTLQQGKGDQLTKDVIRCSVNYSISVVEETSQEFPYHRSARKESLNVTELIPGMSHGMLGMQIGERRELLVHPTLAYGFDALFEPGVSLKIIVELLSIDKRGSQTLPSLSSQKLSVPQAVHDASEDKVAKLRTAMGFEEGWILWNHLKQAKECYSLDQIIGHMREIAHGNPGDLSFDQARKIFSNIQILIGCRQQTEA